jgi:trans-2,3-dihydro-3-hydroxyanthranilate isomerase
MAKRRFFIVDVFAEKKYTGNQLAVVQDADGLNSRKMQAIAKEMSFSETTFILSTKDTPSGWRVRIFTPEHEIPFAGHPTLGTAFVIQREMLMRKDACVTLDLKAGKIPVRPDEADTELLWMKQLPPTVEGRLSARDVAPMLNLDVSELDAGYPIEVVSTGTPFIIVPLRTLDAVKKAGLDLPRYYALIQNLSAKAVLLYTSEAEIPGNDIHARLFADYYGVPEDPATGSANGCLAGYLVRHRFFGSDRVDIKVEQGYEIGRPSLLRLRARQLADEIEVYVGGRVMLVARGELA